METYVTFGDLHRQLQRLLGEQNFDAVIHAAAVSDYAVERIEVNGSSSPAREGKLPSAAGLNLHLKPNPKLLDQLRGWSANPAIRIVAFKLTHAADRRQRTQAIARLLEEAGADAVVHNDLSEMGDGRHPFTLCTANTEGQACADTAELARRIDHMLEDLT
jgi:phosphopantothenoylcysteine decarboxylase/phosphopantothenate--cysteine ligase